MASTAIHLHVYMVGFLGLRNLFIWEYLKYITKAHSSRNSATIETWNLGVTDTQCSGGLTPQWLAFRWLLFLYGETMSVWGSKWVEQSHLLLAFLVGEYWNLFIRWRIPFSKEGGHTRTPHCPSTVFHLMSRHMLHISGELLSTNLNS